VKRRTQHPWVYKPLLMTTMVLTRLVGKKMLLLITLLAWLWSRKALSLETLRAFFKLA